MMKFIASILVFSAVISGAYALCNTCSAQTATACVSNIHFKICVNGLPAEPAIECPTGTICSSGSQVCTLEGNSQAACGRCRVCNGTKTFACTGYNTFSLCYGGDSPSEMTFSCDGSLVCYIDSPQICVDPTVVGIGATCPLVTEEMTSTSTSTTTTTPRFNPAINPQVYCESVAMAGRFDLPTDTTCKGYVLCDLVNGTWIGRTYECPGVTYFNSSTHLCGTEVPERCMQ